MKNCRQWKFAVTKHSFHGIKLHAKIIVKDTNKTAVNGILNRKIHYNSEILEIQKSGYDQEDFHNE